MRDDMASDAGPQFGAAEPGVPYTFRPVIYGLAPRSDGRIATVHIRGTASSSWDLPGGMVDPGEAHREALVREFLEETGWAVEPGPLVVRARQYTVTSQGEYRHNHAAFHACTLVADRHAKMDDDHELVWLGPLEAISRMRHDAAAWAITKWLRLRAAGAL
ncbi:NUDIX domain-containing protein [Maricaulis sp.]|uniref:NUDIX domain-containing protein n=1 Tax=Maricaulis sp. TaxID=1486257 RepID=UPI00262B0FA3|nr:NUDIX domain-containing protein [Maricaulis sp.]